MDISRIGDDPPLPLKVNQNITLFADQLDPPSLFRDFQKVVISEISYKIKISFF